MQTTELTIERMMLIRDQLKLGKLKIVPAPGCNFSEKAATGEGKFPQKVSVYFTKQDKNGVSYLVIVTEDMKEERQGDQFIHIVPFSNIEPPAVETRADGIFALTYPIILKAVDDEDVRPLQTKTGAFNMAIGKGKDSCGQQLRDAHLTLFFDSSKVGIVYAELEYTREDWKEEGKLTGIGHFELCAVTPKTPKNRKRRNTEKKT